MCRWASRYGEQFIKRTDLAAGRITGPRTTRRRKDEGHETDLTAITKGFITLTPLQYNMTQHAVLAEMERSWKLSVPEQ